MPLIVITGASRGIGAAVARAFATLPEAQLALLSRDMERLEEVTEACRASGAEVLSMACDVTEEVHVEETAGQVSRRWGAPDVLVNNAGAFIPGNTLETSVNEFRRQVDVNLMSAYLVTRSFLPGMLARGNGHLFYLCSVASLRGYPNGVAYCAAKHGLLGLSRAVREETRSQGLRVTAVIPGATLTDSWAGTDLPESRFMPVEDIADALLHAYRMSDRTMVEEILLRPQLGDL